MLCLFKYGIIRLGQHRDIIQNPVTTPLCGCDQVTLLKGQVSNRYHWQVELGALPVLAVIPGYVDAGFCSGKQEASRIAIGADDTGEMAGGNAVDDFLGKIYTTLCILGSFFLTNKTYQ